MAGRPLRSWWNISTRIDGYEDRRKEKLKAGARRGLGEQCSPIAYSTGAPKLKGFTCLGNA